MARPSVDRLKSLVALSRSKAARSAFKVAMGEPVLTFQDVDDEAYRLESLVAIAKQYIGKVKRGQKWLKLILEGTAAEFERFLVKRTV